MKISINSYIKIIFYNRYLWISSNPRHDPKGEEKETAYTKCYVVHCFPGKMRVE